jgi:hypothetical protein
MGDYIMIDRSAHFAKSTVRRKVVGIDSALRLDFLALFTLRAVVVHGRIFKARRVAVLGHPASFHQRQFGYYFGRVARSGKMILAKMEDWDPAGGCPYVR